MLMVFGSLIATFIVLFVLFIVLKKPESYQNTSCGPTTAYACPRLNRAWDDAPNIWNWNSVQSLPDQNCCHPKYYNKN